ncbi:MAG: hypothetical protein LJE62_06225 [Silicimonas sp.]|nr:hypothetical protein [Silicimonas sp.]
MVNRRSTLATLVLLAIPLQAPAESRPDFDMKNWTVGQDIEGYRAALFAAHQLCSQAAVERPLSGGEIQACGDVYLDLKLSFLQGVTRERYLAMRPKTRAMANDKGYAAYRAWLHRQLTGPVETLATSD